MSLDKTILDSLASKAAEDWNQKHVLGRAPRYGEQKATGNATVSDLTVGALGEAVPAIQRLKARIIELEKRTAELESRPALKYCGVWVAGTTYKQNSLCTHQGSLWIATQTTASFPGGQAEPSAWVLCCKRGRDGKDGKGAA